MTFYDKYIKYKNKYLDAQKEYNDLINKCNLCNNKSCYCNKQSGGAGNVDLYLFKAQWCGHCINFMPTWEKINKEFNNKINIKTFDVDNKADKSKFDEYQIQGFPTLILNNNNNKIEYNGLRDYESIKEFIHQYTN
jgi:thiol-disulfide isomerase/thioredoxin